MHVTVFYGQWRGGGQGSHKYDGKALPRFHTNFTENKTNTRGLISQGSRQSHKVLINALIPFQHFLGFQQNILKNISFVYCIFLSTILL